MTEVITPEDLVTNDHEFMKRNVRHDSLAPKVAEERWRLVEAVVSEMDRLSELYHEKVGEANAAEREAVELNAKSAATGKAVPAGTALKALEAKLAVDGCLEAFKAQLPKLVAARRAYDALFKDSVFVGQYREAVSAEFVKRRAAAIKAFQSLDTQLSALSGLYQTLGDFTLNSLLISTVRDIEFDGNKLTNGGIFTGAGARSNSWDDPRLTEAVRTVRRYVLNEDPIKGGTLLAEDLNTVAAALPELADKRYEEWQEELATAHLDLRPASTWNL